MELQLAWDREDRALLLGVSVHIGETVLQFESSPARVVYGATTAVNHFKADKLTPVVVGGKAFKRSGLSAGDLAGVAFMQEFLAHNPEELLADLKSEDGLKLKYGSKHDAHNATIVKFILHCWLSGMKFQQRRELMDFWEDVDTMPARFDDRIFRIKPEE